MVFQFRFSWNHCRAAAAAGEGRVEKDSFHFESHTQQQQQRGGLIFNCYCFMFRVSIVLSDVALRCALATRPEEIETFARHKSHSSFVQEADVDVRKTRTPE